MNKSLSKNNPLSSYSLQTSECKTIDLRAWQRERVRKFIQKQDLTNALEFLEKLGYRAEFALEFIRRQQGFISSIPTASCKSSGKAIGGVR